MDDHYPNKKIKFYNSILRFVTSLIVFTQNSLNQPTLKCDKDHYLTFSNNINLPSAEKCTKKCPENTY
jgi:hypothetical protein